MQRYDAFQLVNIRTAHHRQDVDLVFAHAFEREIEPLVGVHVRKGQRIYQLAEFFLRTFRRSCPSCARLITPMTPLRSVTSQVLELARANPLQRLLHCGSAGSRWLAALISLPLGAGRVVDLRRGQVDAVLHRQRFVDGLVLQSRGDEEAHQVRDHQRDDDRIVLGHLEDHQHGGHGARTTPAKTAPMPTSAYAPGVAV